MGQDQVLVKRDKEQRQINAQEVVQKFGLSTANLAVDRAVLSL